MRTYSPSQRGHAANGYPRGRSFGRGHPSSQTKRSPGIFLEQTETNSPRSQVTMPRADPKSHRPVRPPARHQAVLLDNEWRNRVDLQVIIKGLPSSAKALDVWRLFQKYGNIDWIDVHEDRAQYKRRRARVTFYPPPKEALWLLKHTCSHNRDEYTLDVQLASGRASPELETPKGGKFPSKMSVSCAALDFGFMVQERHYMIMRTIESGVTLTLDGRHSHLDFSFTQISAPPPGKNKAVIQDTQFYKFQIPISNLNVVWEIPVSETSRCLVFPEQKVPEFYSRRDLRETFDDELNWSEWRAWWRQTDIGLDRSSTQREPVSVKQIAEPLVDIGRWTTYRIHFDSERTNGQLYNQIIQALRDYSIRIVEVPLTIVPKADAQVWQWLDPPDTNGGLSALLNDIHLTFPVRYQLEVCISQGIINEHNITKTFLQKLSQARPLQACAKLEHAAEGNKRFYDPDRILSIRATRARRRPNSKWTYTRLITITPSRVILGSPALEVSNRVVRAYSHLAENFVRVRFTDENDVKLFSKDNDTWDPIFNRVKRCLKYGLKIGDHHYQFLASGNSQFREGGAFFFAPAPGQDTRSIRLWMGALEHEKTPAKVAARLGQCFSTTLAVQGVVPNIQEGTDVKVGRFTFTDGVGIISPFFADRIAQQFNIVKGSKSPSLFQFRMGGCKGVLVQSPTLKSLGIEIRPSQYKFAAVNNNLEIIRWSGPSEAALNRQIISILRCLSVPDQIFLDLQTENLLNLERAMTEKKAALNMLNRHVDTQQSTIAIAELLDDFMDVDEPFVTSLLHLWRAWKVKRLREKAAITVEKGTFVFGGTDESQTLQGHFESADNAPQPVPEIFLQVTDCEEPAKATVIQGLCIVARNPSLHPGDVRIVRAVDNPHLRHIRDVVIFPQTGDQDIPSMCSGGDLDGDEFLVIWDQDLIPPPSARNHPPMDFSPKINPTVNRAVTNDDLIVNFVNHLKMNNLPQIAIHHIASADYFDANGGAKDARCLELAELHSIAVDFPKTGQPAHFPRRLRVPKKPHFMVPKHKQGVGKLDSTKFYHSSTVLGRLFDSVAPLDFEPLLHRSFDDRVLDYYKFEDDEPRFQLVISLKAEYDYDMRRLMKKHGISTEFEIWTSFVLSHSGHSNDYKISEEVGSLRMALIDKFQGLCYEKAGGKDFALAAPFAAAMYTITAECVKKQLEVFRKGVELDSFVDSLDEGSSTIRQSDAQQPEHLFSKMVADERPLISFPWLMSKELAKIAQAASSRSSKEGLKPPPLPQSAIASDEMAKETLSATGLVVGPTPETETIATVQGKVRADDPLAMFDGDVVEAKRHADEVEQSITRPERFEPNEDIEQRLAEPPFWANAHTFEDEGGHGSGPEDGQASGAVEIDVSDSEEDEVIGNFNVALAKVEKLRRGLRDV